MLIAGGGTGGHLFPGVALAEELVLRGQGHSVLFVGTRHGIEARAVPRAGCDLELIEVGGLKGKGLWGWLKGLLRIPRAVWQSRRILKKYRPDVVVGVGGYASGPVLLAAWLMRLPTAVLEQNALPGLTNRVLGRFVRRVFVAFPQAEKFFNKSKVRLLGNPVRKALADNLLAGGEPESGQHLLVFGGSQGARILNQVVPDAVQLLSGRLPDLKVVHQTGERECQEVKQRYRERGVEAEVLPFIHDMAAAYRKADVVVSRAGATTVAELSLCRKPAVLIPFPYAADNHQVVNAQALVEAGAAVMILQSDLRAQRLADEVGAILADAGRRTAMQEAAGKVGRPESAREICESCLELAKKSRWRGKEAADAS
jgi:UDP-N-acetylglucosamine--N-acetylmuramyl-(pentapeptide) pyrophosphoryl-undecaprenol N-acetylglucosamine transferase